MKSRSFNILIVFLVIIVIIISSLSVYFIYQYIDMKDDAAPVEEDKDLLRFGIKTIREKYNFSEPVIKDHGEYSNIYVDEADLYSIGDGKPVLPVKLSIFEFPFGTEIIDLTYEPSDSQITKINDLISFGSYSPETGMDRLIYTSEESYPIDWVTYHTGGGLSKDKHKTFLVIRTYPVKYHPTTDEIEYIDNVKIKINYKEPEEDIFEEKHVFDLLIISPKSFSKPLNQLVNHKNDNMNIPTKFVTVEEIYDSISHGRDNPEKIKYFIKQSIEKWGIKHVLLVGAIKGQTQKWNLPVRYSHVVPPKEQEYAEESFISDLYYADIYNSKGEFCNWDSNANDIFAEWNDKDKDEMDNYPDVYLGRLACRNAFEVRTMVNKIINYEKNNPSSKNWFDRFILIAGDSYEDEKQLNEGELICERAIELMPGFEPIKVYASETTINSRTINKEINKGAGFVFFCGHGSTTSWGTHYPPEGTQWTKFYKVFHMNFLFNKEKLPIGVIGGCLNGNFDVSIMKNIKAGKWTKLYITHCWAWKLTVKRGGGTIATIANTGLGTHGRDDSDNNQISDYLEVLDGWMELRFLELYGLENQNILGENHGQTITEYLHRFLGNNDKMDMKMAQQWLLFGDPSLKIGG